ncbi:hypothetical protein F0Q45_23520 [Mycobacterium simiae]|uniref:Uncharacterized protein n=1 Tax=Mycobacterium simiae TaxID=1784 RepID=A0A5B1BC68_MYCSI|nr:hypothetical protein [Mycobacterium simiae]KAA1246177.1 hypothetical protein F0Q45_23520 [Mycobacterium simiae]
MPARALTVTSLRTCSSGGESTRGTLTETVPPLRLDDLAQSSIRQVSAAGAAGLARLAWRARFAGLPRLARLARASA